jgi:hypothetical protein
MNELAEQESKNKIAEKLRPARFPNVSGKMFACLGALLNQKWSEPRLASIVATTDGMLLGRAEGDIGFNEMIGVFADFSRNVQGMVESAGDVSIEESEFLELLLKRLQAGEETSSGETASKLAIDAISRSDN